MESAFPLAGCSSHCSIYVAVAFTAFCFLIALWVILLSPGSDFRKRRLRKLEGTESLSKTDGGCNCSCGRDPGSASTAAPYINGARMHERAPVVAERQTGASMMEQLVPEIRTHALSYLDYPSLCRLSMTNSLMRKAANDDNAWKALYRKDFTLEQESLTPRNGWKSYYAATKAIVSINAEFYNIIRERSLLAMGRLWLNADYVKCVHGSGKLFTGYNGVMESWQHAFNWEGVEFQIQDVRARVLTDVAWVTMKAYIDIDAGPFHVTNVYEFHNGRWYMVHHHSSLMLIDGEVEQQIMLG